MLPTNCPVDQARSWERSTISFNGMAIASYLLVTSDFASELRSHMVQTFTLVQPVFSVPGPSQILHFVLLDPSKFMETFLRYSSIYDPDSGISCLPRRPLVTALPSQAGSNSFKPHTLGELSSFFFFLDTTMRRCVTTNHLAIHQQHLPCWPLYAWRLLTHSKPLQLDRVPYSTFNTCLFQASGVRGACSPWAEGGVVRREGDEGCSVAFLAQDVCQLWSENLDSRMDRCEAGVQRHGVGPAV